MELEFSRDTLEKLLFKQILTDKQYMNVVSENFDKRWFKTPTMDLAIELSVKYFKKYGSMPSVKVLKALVKGYVEKKNRTDISIAEASELIDMSVSTDLNIDKEVLEQQLNNFIRKQALYTSIMDNVEDIEKDSDAVLDKCLARFDEISKISFMQKDLGMDYFDLDDMAEHWNYITNPEARIPFLWDGFDRYTNGGVLKSGKMLFLFMGQAGLGKSLFLSNLAVNYLRQGLSVVVISLEMSQDVYAQRFDAHISTNEINHLKDKMFDSCEKIKKFYADHPGANLYIKEYPPRSIRSSDIEIYLENLKLAGKKFDIVIVDYLNLVLPRTRSDNMYKDGLSTSEELRALSYKFNVPVISAVQANTEGMNNENIDMQNLSESRGIAHTCDALFSLYQMPEDRENGIINVRINKNRLGGMVGKVIPMKINPDNLIISDISMDPNGVRDLIKTSEEKEAEKIIKNAANLSSDLNDM